eukprot:TRINITY_DN12158_c0_g1_i4.p1 TRINITY_DN12158_c0_g1~~TRINITY_DN12158_c0_g1_i4.p1  ORF type:complete len:218 (-),score=52.01 TRINITY_DN12158_c0_g1_i4:10-663(-)
MKQSNFNNKLNLLLLVFFLCTLIPNIQAICLPECQVCNEELSLCERCKKGFQLIEGSCIVYVAPDKGEDEAESFEVVPKDEAKGKPSSAFEDEDEEPSSQEEGDTTTMSVKSNTATKERDPFSTWRNDAEDENVDQWGACSDVCRICAVNDTSTCIWCKNGYYLKEGRCLKCSEGCRTCDGARPNQCTSCYGRLIFCLLYTSPSPRDGLLSRMPSSA